MTLKIPQIIGHRGACGYAPENTLDSIRTAYDMGIEWVELDVKLTKDDIPVIFHDDTLDRTTNGNGLIKDILYDDLLQLEAGSWYADSFSGIKIPTLDEALEALIELDMGLNLEIKPCPGREKETAEVALDHLSRVWDDPSTILISSFQHVSLETAMDMAPDFARGMLLDKEWSENWDEIAKYLKISTVNVNGNEVTQDQIETLMDTLEKPILAYTINDAHRAKQLFRWGVDSVFSDVPDVIEASIHSIN